MNPDALRLPTPGEVTPRGLFGERLARCREAMLLAKDESALLAGFLHRPGAQAWVGEHVGKWLDAACTEFERTRDARLATKIERVVTQLRSAQEADGYLGTYARNGPGEARWTGWDVWVHKYVLLGLLAHHRTFHDAASLASARLVGDLLVKTFRDGALDLMSERVSTHAGMAAGSVLLAICRLHRATGEPSYLDLAGWIVHRFEQEGGPRIETSLLAGHGVHETANAKAYELLSCLCGLVDYARLTGDRSHANPALRAFDDVAARHLYVTGGLSFEEYFRAPGTAPSIGDVSETCALVTWMQLCAELFRWTGERKFLVPFERAAWNHLLAAQREDGGAFCYFTPLAGERRFRTDLNCCGSSGPRGLSLVPQLFFAAHKSAGGATEVQVHLLADAEARLEVDGGQVELAVTTDFVNGLASRPLETTLAHVQITATSSVDVELAVFAPSWSDAPPWRVALRKGDRRELALELPIRVTTIEGRGRESGRVARVAGPFVLARPHDGEAASNSAFVPFFTPSDPARPLRVWQEATG